MADVETLKAEYDEARAELRAIPVVPGEKPSVAWDKARWRLLNACKALVAAGVAEEMLKDSNA